MSKLPSSGVPTSFIDAFSMTVGRIQESIKASGSKNLALPVRMYVADGMAVHFYTASRVTDDVDATFSHRMLLPENLDISYRDADGAARLLYFDRQYNDTFGLLHEDAYRDSTLLKLKGLDSGVVEVRLLSPLDLAVSKLARFADHDQDDIKALAARGLLDGKALRQRAEEALTQYIGNAEPIKTSIGLAIKLIGAGRLRQQ